MSLTTVTSEITRKPYTKPVLTEYGGLAHLTASGSGPLVENNRGRGQPRRRP